MTNRESRFPGRRSMLIHGIRNISNPQELLELLKSDDLLTTFERADDPITEGTPLNSATLLKETTAVRLGGDPISMVPDDALNVLKDNIEVVSRDLDTLEVQTDTLSNNLGTLSNNVVVLSGKTDTLSSDLKGLDTKVSNLSTNVGKLSNDLTTLSTDVDTLATDLGTQIKDVSALSVADIPIINVTKEMRRMKYYKLLTRPQTSTKNMPTNVHTLASNGHIALMSASVNANEDYTSSNATIGMWLIMGPRESDVLYQPAANYGISVQTNNGIHGWVTVSGRVFVIVYEASPAETRLYEWVINTNTLELIYKESGTQGASPMVLTNSALAQAGSFYVIRSGYIYHVSRATGGRTQTAINTQTIYGAFMTDSYRIVTNNSSGIGLYSNNSGQSWTQSTSGIGSSNAVNRWGMYNINETQVFCDYNAGRRTGVISIYKTNAPVGASSCSFTTGSSNGVNDKGWIRYSNFVLSPDGTRLVALFSSPTVSSSSPYVFYRGVVYCTLNIGVASAPTIQHLTRVTTTATDNSNDVTISVTATAIGSDDFVISSHAAMPNRFEIYRNPGASHTKHAYDWQYRRINPSLQTWVCPESGTYIIQSIDGGMIGAPNILWGGSSGAFKAVIVKLEAGQIIDYTVGIGEDLIVNGNPTGYASRENTSPVASTRFGNFLDDILGVSWNGGSSDYSGGAGGWDFVELGGAGVVNIPAAAGTTLMGLSNRNAGAAKESGSGFGAGGAIKSYTNYPNHAEQFPANDGCIVIMRFL